MSSIDKKQIEEEKKLARRTVQIIGFGFAGFLMITKIFFLPESDIPWWVIGGFFGVGVSAEFDVSSIFSKGGRK